MPKGRNGTHAKAPPKPKVYLHLNEDGSLAAKVCRLCKNGTPVVHRLEYNHHEDGTTSITYFVDDKCRSSGTIDLE